MINETQMTLATDFRGQSSLVGWIASEKLNGCRAYWDGKQFWSREGNWVAAPHWLTRDLPDCHLDGEIHAGRGVGHGNNNAGYKVAMTAVVQGGKWWDEIGPDGLPIRFTAFDAPTIDGDWAFRHLAASIVQELDVVKSAVIRDPRHLVEYMLTLRSVNAEGAMFRNPDEIGYHAGRTGSLLRWKFQE